MLCVPVVLGIIYYTTLICDRLISRAPNVKLEVKCWKLKGCVMTETRKKPNPIDVYVGTRIRLRRHILGLTQEKLGEKLGVTFQQIQKYEKGTNRVGASRLQEIADIMNVPVSYFFDKGVSIQPAEGFSENDSNFVSFCSSNEGIQLMRAFTNISDVRVRRKIIDLAKALSEEDPTLKS